MINSRIFSISNVFGSEDVAFGESGEDVQSWNQAVFIHLGPRISSRLAIKLSLRRQIIADGFVNHHEYRF